MRIVFTFIALCFGLTACGHSDADLRQQVVGKWFQGPHTLTLGGDGSYTSIFPGKPPLTYQARWHVEHGSLVVTNVKSNSVPMPAGNTTVKIVKVDKHHLELALGTNRISMVR